MDDNDIIQKALEEIQSKKFGFTQQFLAVHEVDLVNVGGRRIDRESRDGTVIVYFPVKDQKFSFAVYLDATSETVVNSVGHRALRFRLF